MRTAMYPLYVVDTFDNYNTGERAYRVWFLWRRFSVRIPRRRMPSDQIIKRNRP